MRAGLVVVLALAACGESSSLRIEIQRAGESVLDPVSGGATRLRLELVGDSGESAIAEGPADAAFLELEDFPSERFSAVLQAFDPEGNVVGYGRFSQRSLEGEVPRILLRRNLAFVIHQDDPLPGEPGRLVLGIDVVRRTVAARFQVGQAGSVARAVTAWGGRGLLVAEQRGRDGFVGIVDAEDLSYRNIPLNHVPDVVVGPAEAGIGVAAGGGFLSFVDLEAEEVLGAPLVVGGRVLDVAVDPRGRRALLAIDISPPGVVTVDLRRQQAESLPLLPDAAGLAVNPATGVAYATSSSSPRLAAVDLASGRSVQLDGSLSAPGGLASWSSALDGVVTVSEAGPRSTLYGYSVFSQGGLPGASPGFDDVTGVVMDGSGRHGVLVAGGEAGGEPGLTLLRARFGALPETSNTLYPEDPVEGLRYRPRGAAILHGD